eukprot:tig00000042_g15467.t1
MVEVDPAWAPWAVQAFWATAIALYAAKAVSPAWNRITETAPRPSDARKAGSGVVVGSFAEERPSGPLAWIRISYRAGWILMYIAGSGCSMAALAALALLPAGPRERAGDGTAELAAQVLVCELLILAQVLRRLYESLFVHVYTPRRMGIVKFAAAVGFYVFVPLSPPAEWVGAWGFRALPAPSPAALPYPLLARLALSVLLFSPGTAARYAVPRGDWFEFLSCPHYAAEVLIYAALCLALPRPCLHSCLAFVSINLGHTARQTHAWYLAKVEGYPKNRAAILPGLL